MRANSGRGHLIGVAIASFIVTGLGGPTAALADRPSLDTMTPATWHLTYNKGPEIELLSSPPQVQVRLDGPSSHGGVTPFTVPGNLRGSYTVEVYKPGFVYTSGQLEFVHEGEYNDISQLVSRGRSRGMLLAMPPGTLEWGQGRRLQGAALMGSEATALTGFLLSHLHKSDALSSSGALAARASGATGIEERSYELQSQHAYERALAYRRAEMQWLVFGGGLWGITYLGRTQAPNLETQFDAEGKLALNLQPVKRTSVLWRSALLPGWGQSYSGRMGAGGGFMVTGLSMVIGTLLADQAYQLARADLIYADQYLEYIRKIDPEETRQALDQLQSAEQTADSAWTTRNLTLLLTGAVWAYNLFDAYYFTRGPDVSEYGHQEAAPSEPATEVSALMPAPGQVGIRIDF